MYGSVPIHIAVFVSFRRLRIHPLPEAEVSNLRDFATKENVFGLEVAIKNGNLSIVRMRDAREDLSKNVDHPVTLPDSPFLEPELQVGVRERHDEPRG